VWRLSYHKPSSREVAYAVGIGIACLVTYWVVTLLVPGLTGMPSPPVAIIWSVISTAFVYRDTRSHSLSAGISRLIGTLISVVLCLAYLSLFRASPIGMAILIAIGTIFTTWLDRPGEIGVTAITTAVVMIVAMSEPRDAWQQPLLRLLDTVVGVIVGVVCKWAASFLLDKMAARADRLA
jgi:uncharacterized membrane protein YgaE (UPF0421/DUF939 family)